jgi:hypothetical protein
MIFLMALWSCFFFRKYMIWHICYRLCCWSSFGFVQLTVCMWTGLFFDNYIPDCFNTFIHFKYVGCLLYLGAISLLKILWILSTIREYVAWFIFHKSFCWQFCHALESTWLDLDFIALVLIFHTSVFFRMYVF